MKKPTLEELKDYFVERGVLDFQEQAETFFDHFTSNGWKVSGRAPMKDWKAAVRNWIRRSKRYAKGRPSHQGAATPLEQLEERIRERDTERAANGQAVVFDDSTLPH